MGRYEVLRSAGLCGQCGKVKSEKCLCDECMHRLRTREKNRRASRLALGLCADCGKRPHFGYSRCARCAAKHRKHEGQRRPKANRPRTATPLKTHAKAKQARERYRERKARRVCIVCGEPLARGSTVRCARHLLKNLASNERYVGRAATRPTRPRLERHGESPEIQAARASLFKQIEAELLKPAATEQAQAQPTKVAIELEGEERARYRELLEAKRNAR